MRASRIISVTARFLIAAAAISGLVRQAQAQPKYTITDLGTLGGSSSEVRAYGINNSGQVVGTESMSIGGQVVDHAFRTAPNSPINPATDDLGTLGGTASSGYRVNSSGQVIGYSYTAGNAAIHAFRTAPNRPINPATDDLGTLGGTASMAYGINNSGQVVGNSSTAGDLVLHAFRTAPNSPINPATDDLGALVAYDSAALDIDTAGRAVGYACIAFRICHAFRTAPNSAINPVTDDLGTLGGMDSSARAINSSGQVAGNSDIAGGVGHAFRTAPNSPINPAADDLGTPGGSWANAWCVNRSGQVVGYGAISGDTDPAHGFLHSGGVMYDLTALIPAGSGWVWLQPGCINDAGQIVGTGWRDGMIRAFRMDPMRPYMAAIQQPINPNGSSIFSASRGVIPVRFTLSRNGTATCQLPPATISVSRTERETTGAFRESVYPMPADDGSMFRIFACQYFYNVRASSLGRGSYRVDITINGAVAGSGAFALK